MKAQKVDHVAQADIFCAVHSLQDSLEGRFVKQCIGFLLHDDCELNIDI